MNILVTGGTGYKGIKLTTRLLQQGHRVTVLDNFIYKYEQMLLPVEKANSLSCYTGYKRLNYSLHV